MAYQMAVTTKYLLTSKNLGRSSVAEVTVLNNMQPTILLNMVSGQLFVYKAIIEHSKINGIGKNLYWRMHYIQ